VLQERCSFKARLRPCIEEFNKNHKKGVQTMVKELGLSASAVADFKFDPKLKPSAKEVRFLSTLSNVLPEPFIP
jgi:hypothetical protein